MSFGPANLWFAGPLRFAIILDMKIELKKLHPDAKLPAYAHAEDAGMDFFALESVTILPGERAAIKTGIAMAIPVGYVGLFWDKSGVAVKRGMKTIAGVIDAGYRGEVLVGLHNLGNEPQTFNVGDKVAQMLIQKVEHFALEEVSELDETARGEGGFGSTGV